MPIVGGPQLFKPMHYLQDADLKDEYGHQASDQLDQFLIAENMELRGPTVISH